MRIHIQTSSSKDVLPYNYQPILTGTIHKWLQKNDYHDGVSLYSFSWLNGAESVGKGLRFLNGANFFISSFDNDFLKTLYEGIKKDSSIANGLEVTSIKIQEDPVFESNQLFYLASPVLIKCIEEDKVKHYTFNDKESNHLLTETLKNKLNLAGLSDKDVKISFERDYLNPKTKLIHYKGIGNKVSICPVRISGTPEQLAFAWNVGIGNSTGIGFGALK